MKTRKKDLAIAKTIKKELQEKLGDKLVSVVLYGSRARGDAREDSDLDLFVLLQKKPTPKERATIADVTFDVLMQDDLYVSAVPYDLNSYKEWKDYSPVLYWIDKEGIKV